jgi:hypothetical protein
MRKFAPLMLLAIALVALPSFADTPAITITNLSGDLLGNGPFTLGWEFTANQNMTVTALGVFDGNQDGLVENHPVGIWDSAGNLVGSTVVGAGTVDPLTNQFRYSSVSFNLVAGETYEIGAIWNSLTDDLILNGVATGFADSPGVTFIQNSFIAGGTLSDPINHADTQPAYFGPNFLYSSTTSTPEPSSLLLLGSGLLGAVGVIRRKINL